MDENEEARGVKGSSRLLLSTGAANYNHSCGRCVGYDRDDDDDDDDVNDDDDDDDDDCRRGEFGGVEKGCIYPTAVHTGATEDGPRWKSAAFRGTGQENCLTTFRTATELPVSTIVGHMGAPCGHHRIVSPTKAKADPSMPPQEKPTTMGIGKEGLANSNGSDG
ncbi:hypothetical protein HZH68_016949 [Vespula germanica]|uniref:Uncharacterized protein n=1 Tax=Vespula germanica TaxID=30212 RepID=A0A834IZ51_VESGE|nr:hypothetical protein HZH68_016949 [Vespula germanica]